MIPKRAMSALATTAFALALLLSFKTPEAPSLAGSTTSGTVIVGRTSTSDTAATPSPSGRSTAPAIATAGSAATPVPIATEPAATNQPTATTTPITAGTYADGTYKGSVASTRFGNVQVQVTIAAGAITDISALQLPSRDGRSVQIAQIAEPILHDEALTAQSAQIDTVSGATYTSQGYEKSLQSALDAAHA